MSQAGVKSHLSRSYVDLTPTRVADPSPLVHASARDAMRGERSVRAAQWRRTRPERFGAHRHAGPRWPPENGLRTPAAATVSTTLCITGKDQVEHPRPGGRRRAASRAVADSSPVSRTTPVRSGGGPA